MKKNSMIRKAANSFAGRLLRRILGEENGQAMMEYIILGLLIATATVVAVGYLGNIMNMQISAMSHATAAQPNQARTAATAAQTTAPAADTAISAHSNKVQGDGADVDVTKGGTVSGW